MKGKIINKRTSPHSVDSHKRSPQISSYSNKKLSQSPTEIFKITPTIQMMNSRTLPQKISGRHKIVGNPEHLSILYEYIKKIGNMLFVQKFFSLLFPKELDKASESLIYICNCNKSKIPVPKRSNENINLSYPFDQLKRLMKTRKSQVLAIIDFCLLYLGFVIVVSTDDNLKCQAINLLKSIFKLGMPNQNTNENSIVFAILINNRNSNDNVKNMSIDALSLLADIDENILKRIQIGVNHHDANLSEFCKEIISRSTKAKPELKEQNKFLPIQKNENEDSVIQSLTSYEEMLNNGEIPEDPLGFIQNIVQTMQNYSSFPSIFGKCTNCLMISLSFCHNYSTDLISEILDICFTILSGDQVLEGNDSFIAFESIELLTSYIFEQIPSDILMKSIPLLISIATESRLNLILIKVKEYISESNVTNEQIDDIIESIKKYHPNFSYKE